MLELLWARLWAAGSLRLRRHYGALGICTLQVIGIAVTTLYFC